MLKPQLIEINKNIELLEKNGCKSTELDELKTEIDDILRISNEMFYDENINKIEDLEEKRITKNPFSVNR